MNGLKMPLVSESDGGTIMRAIWYIWYVSRRGPVTLRTIGIFHKMLSNSNLRASTFLLDVWLL